MAIRQTKKLKEIQDDIISRLSRANADSFEIAESSENALKAYRMDKYGNEIEGRSQFVSSEILETVEWILPTLLKLITSSGQVAEILPVGPEDEQGARLMNQKVNSDLMRSKHNKGYIMLHDWFKAACLQPVAAVKYWWEVGVDKEPISFVDLTADEVAVLEEDPEIEVAEKSMHPETELYDVEAYKLIKYSRPRVKPVAPEDFRYEDPGATCVEELDLVAHRVRMHRNKAKSKYKLSDEDINMMMSKFDDSEWLRENRFADIGGSAFLYDLDDKNFVYVWECYVNEYDEHGVETPMKVTILGDKVVDYTRNSYGRPPFAVLSAYRIPHRFTGMSVYDILGELQRMRTALMRAILDNIYYQNNGINVVNPYRINLDDVLNRKEPGATWRTLYDIDPSSAVYPVPTAPLAPQTMEMVNVTEKLITKRSGITTFDNEFQNQTMANARGIAVSQILGAAHERVEMLAHIFAETGVKDLVQAFVDMNLKFFDMEQAVKINEEWETIDPESIKGEYDLVVEYSAGAVGKEVKVHQLLNLIQSVLPISQAGYQGVFTAENLSNIIKSILQHLGFAIPEKYVSNPGAIDPAIQAQMQQMQQQVQALTQQVQMYAQANQQLQQQLSSVLADKQIDMLKIQQKEESELRDAMLKEKKIELDALVDTANIVAPKGSGYEGA